MRISDWSSDVCSSDLAFHAVLGPRHGDGEGFFVEHQRGRHGPDVVDILAAGLEIAQPPALLDVGQTDLGKIGRASCRESVCQAGSLSVVAASLKKNNKRNTG